jgi:hypothetical protein
MKRVKDPAVLVLSGLLIVVIVMLTSWNAVTKQFSGAGQRSPADWSTAINAPVVGSASDTIAQPISTPSQGSSARPTYTPEERRYAASLANNLKVRTNYEDSKGGTGRRALDFAAIGFVNAKAYIAIRSARQTGDLVTQADINYFGKPTSGVALRAEPTFIEAMRVDASPVIVLGAATLATLLCLAYSIRKGREQPSKERSIRYWKEGLKIGAGFAVWIAVANRFSPAPFSDRLSDSAGAFLVALSGAVLIGIVSGAGATSISERGLSGNRITRAGLTATLTFAQLGLLAAILG